MARLGRVHEQRRRAGRGQRRRDLARHVPRLAHARDDHPPARRQHALDRRGEGAARASPPSSSSAAASIPTTRRPVATIRAGSRACARRASRPPSAMREDVLLAPSRRGRARPGAAGSRSRPAPAPPAPRAPAARRAPRAAGAGRARPRRRIRAAPALSVCRPPVARLLLLGDVDLEHLAQQVLQPVPVGVGAHQPRGDLGAVDRRASARRSGAAAPRCRTGRSGTASARAGSPSSRTRFGAAPAPARPAPDARRRRRADSCTRQSRSRAGTSPIVSLSIATTGPRSSPSGRSPS